MMVHVFRRPDGKAWADYADLGAREGHKRIRAFDLRTRADMESLIKHPGTDAPERVRALAERALSEHMARAQAPPITRQQHAVAVAQIERWGFWRRMKWVFSGR